MSTIIALLVSWSLCWFAQPQAAPRPLDVSLVQLIANPEDYEGKVVRVIGYVRLEFEGTAIYLHRDDEKDGIYKNGLWIEVTKELLEKKGEYDRRCILLEGTFDAKMKGHKGLWSGSIRDISRFEVWR